MEKLTTDLQGCSQNTRNYIICGDWNYSLQRNQLKKLTRKSKELGFLPEERDWLDQLFANEHWRKIFKILNQEAEQYTCRSNRGQSWAKNIGWRVDYQMRLKTK